MTRPLRLFFLLLFSVTVTQSQHNCTQSCGPHKVLYPFGFSPSCHIPLTCAADSEIQLAGFSLRNITPDTILLDLPPICNRPIRLAKNLFTRNFALTRKNGLFFRNCTSNSTSGCVISTELISNQFDLQHCGSISDNLTCFADPLPEQDRFLSLGEVTATGCKYLFSSVRYEVEEGNLTALVMEAVELGWWVEGAECRCSANASCTSVKSTVGPGYRCRCNEGFEGSGFADDDRGGCDRG